MKQSVQHRTLFACFLLLWTIRALAAVNHPINRILAWTEDEVLAVRDSAVADTSYLNLALRSALNDYSIANTWNGNMVSPTESKIRFRTQDTGHRTIGQDFIFSRPYAPYLLTPSNLRFYDTTVPFSWISYDKGFKTYREENHIDFGFTANLNRRVNLGLQLNYKTAVGRYENQAGKVFKGAVFGRYAGNHYGLESSLILNNVSNFENGGLLDGTDYLNSSLEAEDYPTQMTGMSGLRYISGWLNHHYSITVERERQVTEDSVTIDYIPVTTFQHTLAITQECKKYVEKSSQNHYFNNTYFNQLGTNDTANVLNIRNTLLVRFEEEFNKILHFGADVYAINEAQRYAFDRPDTIIPMDSTMQHKWVNNTFVGGRLYKKRGRYIFFDAMGDICLVGYKLGEFKVVGNLKVDIPLEKKKQAELPSLGGAGGGLLISADVSLKNEQPSYFLQHYLSNHFCWDNDFRKIYRFYVGGEVFYPNKYVDVKARVDFENLTRYIYFGEDGLPMQHDGNIQVLSARADVNLHTKFFNMDNAVVWQHSTSAALPLPDLTLYHNIYYHDCWFKALDTQWGVTLRYHTKYYAPLLNPATGQFCIQSKEKIGNYPMMDVYANFYVKNIRLRLFVEYTHFSALFMSKHKNYYSMPNYPQNPAMFRAGLAWHFYK